MPGDNIVDPQLTYRELNGHTQIACIPMEKARTTCSVISGHHSMQTFPNPILRSSLTRFQTFFASNLIVASMFT
jgi:hypothetical protein